MSKFWPIKSRLFLALFFFFNLAFCGSSFAVEKISQQLWLGLNEEEISHLKKVNSLLEEKKYDEAMSYAKKLQNEIAKSLLAKANPNKITLSEAVIDLVLWQKFSDENNLNKVSFSDISRFTIDNPFYPNITKLRKNVEQIIMENDLADESIEQYFKLNPPLTTKSKIYAIDAKIDNLTRKNLAENEKSQAAKSIQNKIAKIWENEDFSIAEEESFLSEHQNQLTVVNHANRLEKLLFENKITEAKRVLKFLDDDYQKLFNAIMEMQNSPRYIDKVVNSVPRFLRSSEALLYRRINWYRSKDQIDDVIDLILEIPQNSRFAEKWWGIRRLYGREFLKTKDYKDSYKIISNHDLKPENSDFWEAQWTSGWIALRFLDKPEIAKQHFTLLYQNVSQPVTLARAAYWLGLAYQSDDDTKKAIEWYKIAAKYPTFFYGQLAIHKHRTIDPVGAQSDIILPKDPDISEGDKIKIAQLRAAQMAYILMIVGDKDDATKIFEWLINNVATEGQIAAIMKIVNEFNDREIEAKLSRSAAKRNVLFIKDKFQIIHEIAKDSYAPLVHAIIKQESGFAPSAVSQVGAIGFMQLMPATAQLVAKEMKIPYSKNKLAKDIKYNVKLGSFYIKKLIDRFDGSEMLAIASYNAGPNATQRWINEFYDPRKEDDIDKVVDWIELITYSETRNYVQRIMENMIVYKYLMARKDYDNIK